MDNFKQEDEKSKYNSGLHQIERISYLKNLAHSFAEKEDWNNYEKILDRFWVELRPDCKDSGVIEEIKKEILEIKRLRTGFDSDKINFDELREYPNILKRVNYKNRKLKEVLEKYEVELRKIENKLGLGVAYMKSSDEGID